MDKKGKRNRGRLKMIRENDVEDWVGANSLESGSNGSRSTDVLVVYHSLESGSNGSRSTDVLVVYHSLESG